LVEKLEPHEQVIDMARAYITSRAIHALAELGIADHIGDRALSAEELARVTNTNAPSLYRLLRAMAALGFFTEDAGGRFTLAPLGAALRSGAPGFARSVARTMGNRTMWNAFGHLTQTLKTGEAVLRSVGGEPIFAQSSTPEQTTILNEAMMGAAGGEPEAITAAYDFSSIRTLVDVGGNTGSLLSTILFANPLLRGVLYDMPHVVSEGRRLLQSRGVADRCEIIGGSFFDSIPASGDAYMLSHIIHDWPEEKCLAILRNVRRAVPDGGRLLIVEYVIPPGNAPHLSKFFDLILMTITGGMERTADQYAALLAQLRFRVTRVIPTRVGVSIVEAEPC
jgi:hypothetical protein